MAKHLLYVPHIGPALIFKDAVARRIIMWQNISGGHARLADPLSQVLSENATRASSAAGVIGIDTAQALWHSRGPPVAIMLGVGIPAD